MVQWSSLQKALLLLLVVAIIIPGYCAGEELNGDPAISPTPLPSGELVQDILSSGNIEADLINFSATLDGEAISLPKKGDQKTVDPSLQQEFLMLVDDYIDAYYMTFR